MKRWPLFILLLLWSGSLAACQADTPTVADVATVSRASATPSHTSLPAATSTPQPIASPLPTEPPTITPSPTQTAVPLPLPTMSPFPTVTPGSDESENKPVFLMYAVTGGDGGGEGPDMGSELPAFVIFGDGNMLRRQGPYGAYRLEETYLTAVEMCSLRQQIADTGFLDPHDDYYTDHEDSEGAPYLLVQLEERWFDFYTLDMPYLIPEMSAGLEVIQAFSPDTPFTPFIPTELFIRIDKVEPYEGIAVADWPTDLPPLTDLWTNRNVGGLIVPAEYIIPFYAWFDNSISQRVIVEDDTYYSLVPNPRTPSVSFRRPLDYAPFLSCDDEPTLISAAVPTITPTPAPVTRPLQGLGRIAFTNSIYSNDRIQVMDADGSNRVPLTRFQSDSPAWSPDGQLIAFVAYGGGAQQIHVMNADGTDVRRLTDFESDSHTPVWSPDGSRILFARDRGTWRVTTFQVMQADGSDVQIILNNGDRNLVPDWSADGTRLVYVKEIEFNKEYALYLLDMTQQPPLEEQIPLSIKYPFSPRWSPDGSQIAFTYRDEISQESVLAVIEPDGNLVTEHRLPFRVAGSLDWTADAAYLIFTAYKDTNRRDIFALNIADGRLIQLTHTEQDESSIAVWP